MRDRFNGETMRTQNKERASRRRSSAARRQTVPHGACNHHWVIDPPNGPTSPGSCKLCGLKRRFPNSSEDSIWDGAEGRSRWNDMGIARRRRPASEEPVVGENAVSV